MASLCESLVFIAILLVVFSGLDSSQASPNVNNLFRPRRGELIKAHQGAVAADDGRCSKIGRDVLREGGHAVDATVATALCLGVVSPASSGLGGGAFMLVRLATGEAEAYDMRETAPASASQNMYANNPSSKLSGALSVAVPGELAGLHQAWLKYGRIPWKRLVQPAIHLAERFIISPYLAYQINSSKEAIFADKGLHNVFTSKGNLLQVGDICHNLKLAKTLEAIAKFGPKVFYNGTVGVHLVKDVQRAGGILTLKDLQTYTVRVTKPLSADIMGYKILGMPPPSSGGAGMILVLNILASYGVPSAAYGIVGLHRTIEAFKHMFALRMNLGDPEFVNITNVLSDMLSPKFAAELRKTIYDNMTFDPSHYGGNEQLHSSLVHSIMRECAFKIHPVYNSRKKDEEKSLRKGCRAQQSVGSAVFAGQIWPFFARWNESDDHGTSHACIVDRSRNAVSITSTVNSYFGAGLFSQKTGIVLNNEMDDFSIPSSASANALPQAPANFVRPFKRPVSSMTPTIVLQDGQLRAVLGASGGIKIIAATTELFLNYFIKRMDALSSVTAPRVYHQLIPNVVSYENWTTVLGEHIELPSKTIAGLLKRGHKLKGVVGGSMCQIILHDLHTNANMTELEGQNLTKKNIVYGNLIAVSDPRKAGFPAGF